MRANQMGLKNTNNMKNEKINMIVYGNPGAGKTTLLSTIGEPVLILDFEQGLESLKGKDIDYFDMTQDLDDSDVRDVDRYALLLRVLGKIKSGEFEEKILKKKIKWIAIDSLTELTENILKGEKRKEEQRAKEAREKESGFNTWGGYNEKVIDLIKGLRDMSGYNIIVTALATKHKDEKTGVESITASIQGGVRDRIPAIYGQVLYLHKTEDEQRTILTKDYKSFVCKDRSGTLTKTEPANLKTIINKIRKGKK